VDPVNSLEWQTLHPYLMELVLEGVLSIAEAQSLEQDAVMNPPPAPMSPHLLHLRDRVQLYRMEPWSPLVQ
jgi:hypothetical protein